MVGVIALRPVPLGTGGARRGQLYLRCHNNVGSMAIFGKKGPKTSLGTMNRIVEGDGRKNNRTQTSNEINNLSGGIFGKKRRK